MPVGIQEIIALLIVAAIVGVAIYRRVTRRSGSEKACCTPTDQEQSGEQEIHWYRRNRD